MDSVSLEPTTTARPPAPDTTRPAGRLPMVLLLAGSRIPVLGAVLLTPVLPSISHRALRI
jgi:hypothetical protein